MYILYRQNYRINKKMELEEIGNKEIIEKSENFEQLKELAEILRNCEIFLDINTTSESFIIFNIEDDSKPKYQNNIC